jgi:hypothetical protein
MGHVRLDGRNVSMNSEKIFTHYDVGLKFNIMRDKTKASGTLGS